MELQSVSCFLVVAVVALVCVMWTTYSTAESSASVEVCQSRDATLDELAGHFSDPPNKYRMVQYIGHHANTIPFEGLEAYGIGGVMLFLDSQDYLQSESAWEHMVRGITSAKAAGYQVWVGDDNGYPSGTAGGRVVEVNAAYEARGLTQITLSGQGKTDTSLDLPQGMDRFVHALVLSRTGNTIASAEVRVTDSQIVTSGVDGTWTLYAYALKVIDEGTQAKQTAAQFHTDGRYANLLNADAMKTFVELTHRQYERRLGDRIKDVDLFYTNEPNPQVLWFDPGRRPNDVSLLPWDVALPERFEKTHGYDLMPRLNALFGGQSDEDKLVRRHFQQTVGDILAGNFTGRIAQWADEAGVKSSGHPLLEEYSSMHVASYGNMLQFVAKQHVPACDIPMPDVGGHWNYWMPKYISAVAPSDGDGIVVALLDPIIGRAKPLWEPTPQEFRRIINMAFLSGVNQISTYLPWQQRDAETYRHFNVYIGRLAVMLRGAQNASTIAMYYPIETFQAEFLPDPARWPAIEGVYRNLQRTQDQLAKGLLEARKDFNVITAEDILSAEIEDAQLVMPTRRLRTILMPHVKLLPLAVLNKLQAFEASGGKVLWVDALPQMGDSEREHAVVAEAMEHKTELTPEQAISQVDAACPGFDLTFDAPAEGFFLGRYTREGKKLYYLVNNTSEAMSPVVGGTRAETVDVYDPMTGKIALQALPAKLNMQPYTALLVVAP